MTTEQYLFTLKNLGLTPASQATAAYLGLSVRQCQRIAAGQAKVPKHVVLLLTMYIKHGLQTKNDA